MKVVIKGKHLKVTCNLITEPKIIIISVFFSISSLYFRDTMCNSIHEILELIYSEVGSSLTPNQVYFIITSFIFNSRGLIALS